MNRRALLAAVVTSTLTLAACDTSPSREAGQAQPQSAMSPAERLAQAADRVTSGPYKFAIQIKGSINFKNSGHVDPKARTATYTFARFEQRTLALVRGEIIVLGDQSWWKLTEPAPAPEKWLLITAGKLRPDSDFSELINDPTALSKLLKAVVEVAAPDAENFEGTIDTTQIPSVSATAQQLGQDAKTVPFTAEQDAEGRLTAFILNFQALTGSTDHELTLRFYGFGTPLNVQPPPPDEVAEPSDDVLRYL